MALYIFLPFSDLVLRNVELSSDHQVSVPRIRRYRAQAEDCSRCHVKVEYFIVEKDIQSLNLAVTYTITVNISFIPDPNLLQ